MQKNEFKMKYVLTLIALIFLFSYSGNACSMYKITQDGKTIVGNNEDWINANSEIWFVPAGKNKFGVMNLGFDNSFTQGAFNEAGLVYDAFVMPYLKVKNYKGKIKVTAEDLIAPIMHNYSNVNEVKEHLSKIDLRFLDNTMLVFVDRSGQYLIVEGDELILGKDDEHAFSNFYPSQTSKLEEVNLPSFQSGLKHLKASKSEATFEYCSSVMNSFQQSITQYSSIYDLQECKIRLYHYQNFDNFIELDLMAELKKGSHKLSIPELFPKDTKGYQFHKTYNNADSLVSYYEAIWDSMSKKVLPNQIELLEAQISQMLALTAEDWIKANKDKNEAIKIYRLVIKLFPNNKKVKKNANKNIKRISREIKESTKHNRVDGPTSDN